MKKIKSYLFLMAIFMAMILTASLTVMAEGNEDENQSQKCGEQLYWSLSEEGVLNISGSGAMEDYTDKCYAPWHENAEDITSITLSEGITHIGNHAFEDLHNVNSISLQNPCRPSENPRSKAIIPSLQIFFFSQKM